MTAHTAKHHLDIQLLALKQIDEAEKLIHTAINNTRLGMPVSSIGEAIADGRAYKEEALRLYMMAAVKGYGVMSEVENDFKQAKTES